ncbi:TPA: hypothetical protein N0F65_000935 [Lagenidium giganteum]|uniref:Glycoside hydrolase n=1 Tax=Lagenidium giganteum TaxID=4803 RepID=A0AAV2YI57_9STRA|nr:TPA: hypothetical protein N0F65_000935 [Lagenidium giganteum]
MKVSTFITGALLGLATQFGTVHADLSPITIKGYKMFDAKTGQYFMVKGVDYYPRPNAGELDVNNYDFFSDDHEDIWSQDLPYFKQLGANAVRLYAVNPTISHDKFMCALRAQGMYALIDMGASCEGCYISTDTAPKCYSGSMKTRGEMIIGAFAKYDNVLAFSAGNEINNDHNIENFENAPCQKRFIRDLRKYINQCGLRHIPVGVVMSDRNRMENAQYYNCRTDPKDEFENVEWYGINVYLYCDATQTTIGGGFQKLLNDFQSINPAAPVLVTEYGCLNEGFPKVGKYEAQRTWTQTGWLYSQQFRDVFNGGFVFEYSTERANSKSKSDYPFTSFGEQNYGLGYYSPATCDHSKTKCTYNKMPNFDNLADKYNHTNASDETTMTKFEPASNRTQPTTCPAQIKALSKFDWGNTTNTKSLACPTKTDQFVCPGQSSSGKWTTSTKGSSPGSDAGTGSKTTGSKTSGSGVRGANATTPTPTPTSTPKSTATLATLSWTLTMVVLTAAAHSLL